MVATTEFTKRLLARQARARATISHHHASSLGAELLNALGESEASDIIATLMFDLTPADIAALETFAGHVKQRIADRGNK